MVIRNEDLLDSLSITDASTTDSWAILTPATTSLADEDQASGPDSSMDTDPLSAPHAVAVTPIQLLLPDQDAAVTKYVDNFAIVNPRAKDKITPEIQIKALMLGDYNVGMSVLANRIINDTWLIGYDTHKYEGLGFGATMMLGGKRICLDMLVERPKPQWSVENWPEGMIRMYAEARHCEACFLVYDVTSRASFEATKSYYWNFERERTLPRSNCRMLCRNCCDECPQRPAFQGSIFVLANKIDCDGAEWAVSLQEGREFASSIGPLADFIPISVKTGENCASADVQEMTRRILFQRVNTPSFAEDRARRIEKLGKLPKVMSDAYFHSQLYWY